MMHQRLSSQRGISFIGLLILGIVLALLAIVGARVLPTATEFMAIQKAVKKAAADGDTVPAVRAAFDRTAAVDYISSISGKDLEITKQGDKVVVEFAYDKEIPLAGPAYLLLKYRGSSASGYN
ncbi:MAG: DUF4845 domain-containing protein [Ottowia sp.]|jgi:hypothetical protein|uniref:DUF4845 domain-containing protein n=2 Tax=Ottowia beijingensis TaxID=1207057 RepID=A0A853IYM0_9BURK|nr:DUF4845 domain-containing protein [Ottowia beijingensis]MBP6779637.1 DUF4845 domain-containing protein [Ottowia sp.]MBP7531217.1 DUF4845 domain-containing protein [Ottowia sp.]MBP7536869.1 DUF4845 domain-containing protein [Ottowia sp.]MBP9953974.1 DUF4845 domain-containing protein [Ottowia sp.]NZA02938.1 DUF4845 domain-containing protein [Ottowia beijingensis]